MSLSAARKRKNKLIQKAKTILNEKGFAYLLRVVTKKMLRKARGIRNRITTTAISKSNTLGNTIKLSRPYTAFSLFVKFNLVPNFIKAKIIKKHFKQNVGYIPNIKNPESFNEKVQWMKLYYKDPLMTICTDKYAVRDYVKSVIGEEVLIEMLGSYNSASEIDFENLPNKFVLKTNNSSGTNIICTNKAELNIDDTRSLLDKWMRPEANHYLFNYEWCYKDIKPKIVCEKFIDGLDDLKDYKLMCFNGKVELVLVCSERSTGSLKIDFFDTEWNRLPFKRHYDNSQKTINPPTKLREMIIMAEKLSKPFPFVRVDFYESNEKVIFGELTFYPGGGFASFTPVEWDYKIGDMFKLPKKRRLRVVG